MCGREVGLWLDERHLVIATCWEPDWHRWECRDPVHDLRWQPGTGVDSTGTRYLIDLVDLPVDDLVQLRGADPLVA